MSVVAEGEALLPVLDDLAAVVEELVRTGLTTATPATRQRIEGAFREAARRRLGRLAASLRYVNEELGRFLSESPDFSARRLGLFLNRAWILAKGLSKALRAGDEALVARLNGAAMAPQPVRSIELVVLGVQKRVNRATCAFDFRMREVGTGRPIIWSFLANRTAEIPAEAWLHLPQSQKFKPKVLLEHRVVRVERAALAPDDRGGARLLLGPPSTLTEGDPFLDWDPLFTWDRAAAHARLLAASPSPLDLEVELHEEVALRDYVLGPPEERPAHVVYPLRAEGLALEATVPKGETGHELREALDGLRAVEDKPPLFGVLHYAYCRLVFTPLSVLQAPPPPKGRRKKPPPAVPRQLMLSSKTIDSRTLVGALKL